MAEVARVEGFLMCPEGAATYAALKQALADGRIRRNEQAVLFNCATGLKYPLPPVQRTLGRRKPIDSTRCERLKEKMRTSMQAMAARGIQLDALAQPSFGRSRPQAPKPIPRASLRSWFPSGRGATDTLTRTLADHMRTSLGRPIVIENVAGAGGTLGVARVTRAAPDGYTLGVGNWAAYVAAGASYPVHFDLLTDLQPIAKLADTPLWIVTRNTLPVNDLKELIVWLKANPDRGSAGIVGFGSGGHICGLTIQNATGARFQFVPYRGGALVMQDLVAGHIDFMCDMAANSLPQVRAGAIKPIAVMAHRHWFAAPNVPTAEEAGLPGVAMSLWHGISVPQRDAQRNRVKAQCGSR